jgi:hypothetical protein
MLKHLLSFTMLLVSFCGLNAQFTIIDSYGGAADTVETQGDAYTNTDLKLYLRNDLNRPLDSMYIKHISTTKDSSWFAQFCAGSGAAGQCYDVDAQINNIGVNWIEPMAATDQGETNEMKVNFMCFGTVGIGVSRYYLYHLSDTNGGDTVTFIYDAIDMSSAQNIEKPSFNVFPTVAQSFLNLETSLYSGLVEANIYNVLGQKVGSNIVSSQNEKISLEQHEQGCYFITLSVDNTLIGTKSFYISR